MDRFRGALLGLAVGDALGTTLEFKRPGTFKPIADLVGGGPFQLKPGEWTDDTSMALCLAESLLERGGSDPVDQLRRYTLWWKAGHLSSNGRCFDIGNTVKAALRRFETTGEPWCGSTDPDSAGNGSLMRLAPVPMYYLGSPDVLHRCADSSRTTHGAPEAVDACRYYGGLIAEALRGVAKGVLLSRRSGFVAKIDEVAAGSFKSGRVAGTGYVVRSLEAALWAFHGTDTFRDGALKAVNLGDDADTTGAIYGQLAGAFYGVEGIPREWRGRLAHLEMLETFADRLRASGTKQTV
ncbi:MAG TPA: ADP-ribosylglycohydrolase family protein [Planctomycetota bacterium]